MQKELLFALFEEFSFYEHSPFIPRDPDLQFEPLPFPGQPGDLRFLLDLKGHAAIREVKVSFQKGATYDIGSGAIHQWGTVIFYVSWKGGPGCEAVWEAMWAVWPDEMNEWSKKWTGRRVGKRQQRAHI
jgi:hypothetical protein